MDYVEWCGRVLRATQDAIKATPISRTQGIDWLSVARRLYSDEQVPDYGFNETEPGLALADAWHSLQDVGALESDQLFRYRKVTDLGRQYLADPVPVWRAIADRELELDQEQLLRIVNSKSSHATRLYVVLRPVEGTDLLSELGGDASFEHFYATATELTDWGLVHVQVYGRGLVRLSATFRGLVWETRREYTIEAERIDTLRRVGEVVNVDFKRELKLKPNDPKAEFVKDVLGLANVQVAGRRWLIIGFDDKTLDYYGSPDPNIKPDDLQNIVNCYTDPPVTIDYQVVNYRGQLVGKVEVLSDRTQVPYRVAKAIRGERKHIDAGQVFTRHNTHTEPATDWELQSLDEERARRLAR